MGGLRTNVIFPGRRLHKHTALLVIVAALLAGGCRGKRRRTIAVVPKATSHLFWLSVQAGAMAAGKAAGMDVLWNGPPQETDYDRQIQIVDSMTAQRVDGLAVAAAEKAALSGPIERAAAAGIPVVVFDSGVNTDKYMTYIATDNYAAGKMGGVEMGRLLHGRGEVALILHAPGSASTMDRERGFEDAIREGFPNIHVVARQYGMSDRSKAMAAAEDILTANPSLSGLFASSEPSSVGAALALKSRRLAGRVHLVAFDASDQMISLLREGVISSMVVQDPYRMGYQVVQVLADRIKGKTAPKRIDLAARLVRRQDLDDPDVHRLLHPDVGAAPAAEPAGR